MNSAKGQVLGESVVRARVGELIQGTGSIGRFLVSGPLSSSMVTVTSLFSKGNSQPTGRALQAQHGVKSLRALQAILLLAHGYSFEKLMSVSSSLWEESAGLLLRDFFSRYHISVESNIPVGKGCSSSSADVLGLLSLLDHHFGLGLGKELLYRVAAAIEPTDPLLDEQTVLFDSGTGRVIQTLPERNLAVLYFDSDPDGRVDTLADLPDDGNVHGSADVPIRSIGAEEPEIDTSDDVMLAGFLDTWISGDGTGICSYTTRSALASHRKRPRPGMDLLHRFALDHEAGLFVAHTGTLMGLLFPVQRAAEIRDECARFVASVWGASLCMEYTSPDAMSSGRPEAQWSFP